MPQGMKIAGLMDFYGFAKGEIGVIVVDEQIMPKNYLLEDGMIIHFYPVFAGG